MADAISLAAARYPDVPPDIALRYFYSDRRRADLGAPGASRRQFSTGKEVRNYKRVSELDGRVLYTVAREKPERMEYPPLPPMLTPDRADLTIQLIRRPPVHFRLMVAFERSDFEDQQGRQKITAVLREMRGKALTAPTGQDQGAGTP